jgi:uncharacterized protein YkwD
MKRIKRIYSTMVCMKKVATIIGAISTLFVVVNVELASANSLQDRAAERRSARLEQRQEISVSRSSLQERALARRKQRTANQHTRLELMEQLGDVVALREAVLRAVNAERGKLGIPALEYNTTLEHAAQVHAEDMLKNGYFSHYSRGGEDYVDRMKLAGYGNFHSAPCEGCKIDTVYGENIAKGQRTVEEVIQQWMESLPHKKNILSREFNSMGVGIAGVFWVQNFGAIQIEKY